MARLAFLRSTATASSSLPILPALTGSLAEATAAAEESSAVVGPRGRLASNASHGDTRSPGPARVGSDRRENNWLSQDG
jgi:hypothetical protein